MLNSAHTPEDLRAMIEVVFRYCHRSGEAPAAFSRDLIADAMVVLGVRSDGPRNDRKWHIPPDCRRRVELAGLNPLTFAIEDEKEFAATAAHLHRRREVRMRRRNERQKEKGEYQPFPWEKKASYGDSPSVPLSNGTPELPE
jgi:hypothetical protein